MSPRLKEFLTEWLAWATQPKVEDTFHFYRDHGLCACLANWSRGDVELHLEFVELLERDFKGNYQFPFEGKLAVYWAAKSKHQLHKEPKRLAWVRKQLEK